MKNCLINVGTIKQVIKEDRLDKKNGSKEKNTYQTLIIHDFKKVNININTSQIEQWSILSNIANDVQDKRNPIDCYKLVRF